MLSTRSSGPTGAREGRTARTATTAQPGRTCRTRAGCTGSRPTACRCTDGASALLVPLGVRECPGGGRSPGASPGRAGRIRLTAGPVGSTVAEPSRSPGGHHAGCHCEPVAGHLDVGRPSRRRARRRPPPPRRGRLSRPGTPAHPADAPAGARLRDPPRRRRGRRAGHVGGGAAQRGPLRGPFHVQDLAHADPGQHRPYPAGAGGPDGVLVLAARRRPGLGRRPAHRGSR